MSCGMLISQLMSPSLTAALMRRYMSRVMSARGFRDRRFTGPYLVQQQGQEGRQGVSSRGRRGGRGSAAGDRHQGLQGHH